MNDLAQFFVGGGVATVIVALIGAIAARKMNSANYAEVISRVSADFAQRVNENNRELESKVDALELQMAGLQDRVGQLTDALREAIQRLDALGHNTDPLRAVLNGRRGPTL